jgi:hypothetical protein
VKIFAYVVYYVYLCSKEIIIKKYKDMYTFNEVEEKEFITRINNVNCLAEDVEVLKIKKVNKDFLKFTVENPETKKQHEFTVNKTSAAVKLATGEIYVVDENMLDGIRMGVELAFAFVQKKIEESHQEDYPQIDFPINFPVN